jgi:hypothetical protein
MPTREVTEKVSTGISLDRVIELRRQGLNNSEIARALGCTQGGVSAKLKRAAELGVELPPRPTNFTRGTLAERFAAMVNKDGPLHPKLGTQCWLWTGGVHTRGYGTICDSRGELGKAGRTWMAHRASVAIHRGELLTMGEGVARHLCDTPLCVNPAHLEPGTQKQNIADAVAQGHMNWQKGRTPEETKAQQARAEKRRAAKLRKDRAA